MPGTIRRVAELSGYGHVYSGPPRVPAKLLIAIALSEAKCLTKVRCRGVWPMSFSELMSDL
jgi:hypothetical protein